MLFGQNPLADVYLKMLNLTRSDVGRFRDCYYNNGYIVVYTRNGGGNRDEYWDVFEALANHPEYVDDFDDEFDSTYASIMFTVPEKYKEDMTMIQLAVEEKNEPPADKWALLLEKLGK